MNIKIIFSVIFSISLMMFLGNFIPESSCFDGWNSPSIGSAGACSYHGGVNDHGEIKLLAFIFSAISGVFLFLFLEDTKLHKSIKKFAYKKIKKLKTFFTSGVGILSIIIISFIFGVVIAIELVSPKNIVPDNSIISQATLIEEQSLDLEFEEDNFNLEGLEEIQDFHTLDEYSDLTEINGGGKMILVNCGVGGFFDSESSSCSCKEGYNQQENGKCVRKSFTESNMDYLLEPLTPIKSSINKDKCGEGEIFSIRENKCSCLLIGYYLGENGKCKKKDCGEGGYYFEYKNECSCNLGYGKGDDGKCKKIDCGEGGHYFEFSKECNCLLGYEKSENGKCNKKSTY